MKRRRDFLLSLENDLRSDVQVRFLGRSMNVLSENERCEEGWVSGRSANYLKVRFPGKQIPGVNYQVQITNVNGSDLIGEVVKG